MLELGPTLILKGVAYPTEPSDAANKSFVIDQLKERFTSQLNLNKTQQQNSMLTLCNQYMTFTKLRLAVRE